MTAKDIYLQLATGKISVSAGLALSLVNVSMAIDEIEWIQVELNGYIEKVKIPDYRQLSCTIKAHVRSQLTGSICDIQLTGDSMRSLDSMLQTNYGLSIYKIYVGQGVESIEQQITGHNDGDIIMLFEGGPAQELKESLRNQEREHGFITLSVFQSAPLAYLQNTLAVIKNRLMDILRKYADLTQGYPTSMTEVHSREKVLFISYCWEGEEHKAWVMKFANDLKRYFKVRIDQDLPYGVELTSFMEQAISTSDKVLIIVTPEYKKRADNRMRGVGFETSLITDDLVTDQNRIKFIPIIRKGTKEESFPRYLGDRKGADMTDDSNYSKVFEELLRNLLEY